MGGPESRKVAICFSDITERKKAENALREQNEISNATLNATTETLWLMDLEGNILGANETAAKRLGKTVAEVIGKNGFALTPPHVKELRRAKIREMTQTGKAVQFHDERDGIIFHHTFYPVRDAQGAVKGLVIFSRDITEQKKAEDALKISEARFRTMFERHQAVMLLIEPDSGAIVDANAAAAKFYGYSKEQLLCLNIRDVNQLPRRPCRRGDGKSPSGAADQFRFSAPLGKRRSPMGGSLFVSDRSSGQEAPVLDYPRYYRAQKRRAGTPSSQPNALCAFPKQPGYDAGG